MTVGRAGSYHFSSPPKENHDTPELDLSASHTSDGSNVSMPGSYISGGTRSAIDSSSEVESGAPFEDKHKDSGDKGHSHDKSSHLGLSNHHVDGYEGEPSTRHHYAGTSPHPRRSLDPVKKQDHSDVGLHNDHYHGPSSMSGDYLTHSSRLGFGRKANDQSQGQRDGHLPLVPYNLNPRDNEDRRPKTLSGSFSKPPGPSHEHPRSAGPKPLPWYGSGDVSYLDPSRALGGSIRSSLQTFLQTAMRRIVLCTESLSATQKHQKVRTVDELNGLVNGLRLRFMPPQGSRLDRILLRAEGLADASAKLVAAMNLDQDLQREVLNIPMNCFGFLLQISIKEASIELQQAFGVFDQVAIVLSHLGQQPSLISKRLSELRIKALTTSLSLDLDVLEASTSKGSSTSSSYARSSSKFSSYLTTLQEIEDEFSLEIWRLTVENPTYSGHGIKVETIRAWLSGREVSVKIKDQTSIKPGHSETELPLKWMTELTHSFWKSQDSMLLITGESGCGKSGIYGFLLDRSRARYSRDTGVLYFSVEPLSSTHRSPLHLVKNLLLQLFEKSVGNMDLFNELCKAYEQKQSPETESLLWSILKKEALKATADHGFTSLLIVVDGLDKIEGGNAAALTVRNLIYDIVMQSPTLRCVILSSPIFDDCCDPGVHHYPVDPSINRADIRFYIEKQLRSSRCLRFLTSMEMDVVIERALRCHIPSFTEANLLVAYIELQQTYQAISSALQTVPSTKVQLIEHLIGHIDSSKTRVRNVFYWLMVSKRLMTVRELEIMTDSNFLNGTFGADPSHFLRDASASLIEIRDGTVRFIDPLVKSTLLKFDGRSHDSLSVKSAHKFALQRCLEYLKRHLKATGEITMDVLDQSVDQKLQDQIAADRLLEYSIRYYIVHYSECRLDGVLANFKDAYIDSPQLAHFEQFYWHLEVSGEELEHLHQGALDFRKAMFGGLSQSVIQNLITLAMLKILAGKHVKALGLLGEAWSSARQLLGEKSLVCRGLAHKYSEIFLKLSEVDEEIETFVEELFEFLWTSEKEQYGPMNEKTLNLAELLIRLYRKKNRDDDIARQLYGLYRDCISIHGQLDSRTISYAERLILILTDLGRFSEIETLCRELLTAADCSLELWDPRYLTILFSLVDWYINQGQFTHAKDELQTSWQAIYEVLKKRQTPDTQLAFVQITIRLFKLFRKQDHYHHDARDFMKLLWGIFSIPNTVVDDRLSPELLNLSECSVELQLYEEVIPLLQRLRLIFSQNMIKYHAEATRVAMALSKCYRHQTSEESNVFSLKELFDSLLAMNIMDETLVDLAQQLVNLYMMRKEFESAKLICHSVLQIVWMELATFQPSSTNLTLPQEKQECSIRIALILSDVILAQGNISGAVSLLRALFNCFYKSLSLRSDHLFQVAKRLSFSLQRARLTHEAIAMWKELRATCVLHLGPTHEQCLRIAEVMITLCKSIEVDSREDILVEILDDFEKDFGLWQPLAVETVLTLISLLEEQKKLDEMQGWYHRLWAAITLHRHSGSISSDQLFSVFLSYSKYLTTIRQKFMAIHIAHELSNILRSEMDGGSLLILKTDLELALLLEDDESHYTEAVDIYESLCALQVDTFLQAEEEIIMILIEKATEGLTRIYRRHRRLAGKAEDLLEKAWKESQRLKGCAHQQTFACFLKLIDFYTKQGESKTEKALQKMSEYIIELLLEEHDETCLFEMASKFSELYRELESVNSGIKYVKQLREEIASLMNRRSSNEMVYGEMLLGKVTFWVIDRRSLVFIASVEKMLSCDHQSDSLYSEILQSLLTEAALYEAWSNIKLVKCDLKFQLATGSRLYVYLLDCKRHSESEAIKSDAWEVFQAQTKSTRSSSEPLRALFEVGLLEMSKRQPSIGLLKAITSACLSLHRNKSFFVCLTIVKWAKEYFAIQLQGSASAEVTKLGFEMARYIDFSRMRVSDTERRICEEIQDIVAQIAVSLLRRGGTGDIEFDKISTTEVNMLVRVLGHSKDYKMLVEIFRSLWDSRTKFIQWSQPTIISIGCQLCQALFAYNHSRSRTEALELIEAICYNVRGVYGPVHELTIRCEKIRTSFLVAEGEYAMTFDIHAKIMDEIMHRRREQDHHHQHNDAHPALDDLLIEQGQLMKAAYERNGGWGNQADSERYVRLMTNVFDAVPDVRLHQVGMPSSWQTRAVQKRGPRSNASMGAITQGNGDFIMDSELEEVDLFGCWEVPVDWTIPHEDIDELDDAKQGLGEDDVALHGRQPGWGERLYLEAGDEGHGHISSEMVVREPPVQNWYGSVARGPISEATVDIHRDYEEGSDFPDP